MVMFNVHAKDCVSILMKYFVHSLQAKVKKKTEKKIRNVVNTWQNNLFIHKVIKIT